MNIFEAGHDPANHELVRYSCNEGGREFEVLISRSAKTQAQPSPEQKIKDWFGNRPPPDPRSWTRIPDDHFDPHYRQS